MTTTPNKANKFGPFNPSLEGLQTWLLGRPGQAAESLAGGRPADDLDQELAISTDKADYAPGSTATFTATGVTVGGTVRFSLMDDPRDPGDDGDVDNYGFFDVVDGGKGDLDGIANGVVVTEWLVPATDDGKVSDTADALNATVLLKVTDLSTQAVATTTFTDGITVVSSVVTDTDETVLLQGATANTATDPGATAEISTDTPNTALSTADATTALGAFYTTINGINPFITTGDNATQVALSGYSSTNTSGSSVISITGESLTTLKFSYSTNIANPAAPQADFIGYTVANYDSGVDSGLVATNGGVIKLFQGGNAQTLLGYDSTGELAIALYLDITRDTNGIVTGAKVWSVKYEAIQHGSTAQDELDTISNLFISAGGGITFNTDTLASGQNAWNAMESNDKQYQVIMMSDEAWSRQNNSGRNAQQWINSSKGGGPTTIGVGDQMLDGAVAGANNLGVPDSNGDAVSFTYCRNSSAALIGNSIDRTNFTKIDGYNLFNVRSATWSISQQQGSGDPSIATIQAFNTTDALKGDLFAEDVDRLETPNSDTSINITSIRVVGGKDGYNKTFTTSGTQGRITVTFTNGVAKVQGLTAKDQISYSTGDVNHNRVTITNSGVDGTNKDFDIGSLAIDDTISTALAITVRYQDDAPTVTALATAYTSVSTGAALTLNNAVVQLDDDNLPSGNADGTGDDILANTSGVLQYNDGADGTALTAGVIWTTASSTLIGFTSEVTNNGTWLNIKQNGIDVVKAEIIPPATDGANYRYRVTQLAAIQHPDGNNENNVDFLLTYKVTDGDTDFATGQLVINVDDDTPVVTLTGVIPTLTNDDTNIPDTDGPTSFAGVFSNNFGADGFLDADDNNAEDDAAVTYSLGVSSPAADSGLVDTLSGDAVLLNKVGNDIVGSVSIAGISTQVFRVSVNTDTGAVTFIQSRSVVHNDPLDPAETGASAATLSAAGLIKLTATITDGDGDTAAETANIGQAFKFEDDGPSVTLTGVIPTLTNDDTNIPDTDGPTSFAGVFSNNFGADGFLDADDNNAEDDAAVTYSLGVSSPAANSGLVDTLSGDAVLLNKVGNDIVGSVSIAGISTQVFRVSVNTDTGAVTFTQSRSVVHNDPLDPAETGASAATLSAAGLITLTATITDGDGDTAAETANIGQAFKFEDDGPSVTLTGVIPTLTNDDTNIPDTDGPTSFAGVFSNNFGADGFLDADDNNAEDDAAVTYSLGVSSPAANSGLVDTLSGDAVLLNKVGNDIVGSVSIAGISTQVFRVSVNTDTGAVTFTQSRSVVHNDPLDPAETGASAATLSAAGLITLTATITDGDGDTAAETANIGQAFKFEDDGPSVTLTGVIPTLTNDDTNIPDTDGPTSFAGVFSNNFGADGFLDADDNNAEDDAAVTYSLGVSSPAANSGLVDTLSGDAVLLNKVGNDIVGSVSIAGISTQVFRVSVNTDTGAVTFTQSRSVVHNDPLDPAETGASAATLSAAGLITLTATITDGDGDTAAETANIGQAFKFEDDGPSVTLTGVIPTLTNDDTNIPDTDGPTSFAGVFSNNFGADGFLDADDNNAEDDAAVTYSLGVSSPAANSGLVDTLSGDAVLLNKVGNDIVGSVSIAGISTQVFRVSVNTDTGAVTFTQSRSVVHNDPLDPAETGASAATLSAAGLITLTATITDGDGDTAAETANIGQAFKFEDDGPSVTLTGVIPTLTNDDTNIPDTDGPTSFAGVFSNNFGADGFLDADDNNAEDDAAVTYSLGVSSPAANSGLVDTLSGDAVLLNKVGNDIVGSVSIAGISTQVFRVSVNTDTGAVTFTQSRSVVHNDPLDPAETGASAATLSAAGLITLTATITDGDGDTAAETANIGQAFKFEDDGPSVTLTGVIPTLTNDDTNIPDTDGPTSFAGVFSNNFGADGFLDADDNNAEDDAAVTYSLGVSSPAANSGLVDTLSGDAVLLNKVGNDIVGSVSIAGISTQVFRVSVNTDTGAVTFTQSRSVVHNDPLDPAETGASAATLSAAGLITLTATITDGDGDTAAETANIGQAFKFEDDGPSVTLTGVIPTLTNDDTNIPDTDGPTSFAGVFSNNFGADGFLDADDNNAEDDAAVTYSLGVSSPAANSGLVDTLSGDAVLLNKVGNDIVGSVSIAGISTQVFRVSVNTDTGAVTFTQSRSVVHNDPLDPAETGASAATLSAAGLITLTATITDGDGDTAAETANIGQAFKFEDDGPSVTLTGVIPTLTNDDTNIPDTDGPTSFAGVFSNNFGADGFLDADDNNAEDDAAVTYSLGVSSPAANSGLVDTLSGDAVLLNKVGNDIVGSVSIAGISTQVFRVSVNTDTGAVTFTQSRSVVHNDPLDPAETGASAATLSAAGLITLTATITDGDGDTAAETANIGQAFKFEDDGPSVTLTGALQPILTTDDDGTPTDIDGPSTFSSLFTVNYGADGEAATDELTYTIGLKDIADPIDSGLDDTVSNQSIYLRKKLGDINTVEGYIKDGLSAGSICFTIELDPDTGELALTQLRAIKHNDPSDPQEDGTSAATMTAAGLILLTATATDGDGDSASNTADITARFTFTDAGPTIQSDITGDATPNTIKFESATGPSSISGDYISWNSGADEFDSLSVTLTGTTPTTGTYSYVQTTAADGSNIIIDVYYDADGSGGDPTQKISTHTFNATTTDSFQTYDYTGKVDIQPTELESGSAVKPGGPHPVEFQVFSATNQDLAILVTGATRSGTSTSTVDGLLNTSAQGYASGDTDQNLEFIDKKTFNTVDANDTSEIIEFTFTDYSASLNYADIATTAANTFGTSEYSEPTVASLNGYKPVAGFGFDVTKITGGPKTCDFLVTTTYQTNEGLKTVNYQFTEVAEKSTSSGNLSKVFVGYDNITGTWIAKSWLDTDFDAKFDAGEAINGKITQTGDDITGLIVEGIVKTTVENNEFSSPTSTWGAEGFNVTNPRFYSYGNQTEIVPDFGYTIGLKLTDGDDDFKNMTITTTIDGSDTGSLTTQALA